MNRHFLVVRTNLLELFQVSVGPRRAISEENCLIKLDLMNLKKGVSFSGTSEQLKRLWFDWGP